jgi:multicomponent Na+:H+ antiporter subunit F
MIVVILFVISVFLLLGVYIIVKGPAVWDRFLGLNIISAKIIIIILLLASQYGQSNLLDFAIVYALLGFIGTVFTAHFIMERKRIEYQKAKESEEGIGEVNDDGFR